ncbi:helix-turn-helix transcriptional regulator [Lentzea flava]|uniref:Helix-turn-helix transcriptional regulator n=1 Tax=Lentzea flava TaxID=103732 RepID=A0ABQ2UCK8_9PSEU|nr:response regulator transcription factor [Lentzea flava]MCP2196523.1 DNA-binding response regulator, NarL/FixJ family, contains REC and HTH domains [Lentzea flava]GGU17368.1 helix-turn-helix transcriptional regulator [Lentzea flava]
MQRVRVAVHAKDAVTRWGIAGYLRLRPEIQVLAEHALAQADVVLVAADGARLTAELQCVAQRTSACVVLITDHLRAHDLPRAIDHRVVAVLPRAGITCESLVSAVLAAHEGRAELPADLALSCLAERELDMLRLFAEGWTTAEVAKKLSYSERTVKSVVQNVLTRFQLRNRTHAVAFAIRAGAI